MKRIDMEAAIFLTCGLAMACSVPAVEQGHIGGGLQTNEEEGLVLHVLAPDHTGFTLDAQPSLYWYISKTTANPIMFTLTVRTPAGREAILGKPLDPPIQPGVQQIRLKDYGLNLELGVQYMWFVWIMMGPEPSSKNIVASGLIERIPFSFLLPHPPRIMSCSDYQGSWAAACFSEAANRYAEVGIWYDAITSISEAIEKNPADPILRKKRAFLLEQIGLKEVAKYDNP